MKTGFLSLSSSLFLILAGFSARAVVVPYSVPFKAPILASWSQFKVDVLCAHTKNSLTVQYTYPFELTGVDFPLTLTQDQTNPNLYTGPNGSMTCVLGTCTVHYKDLPFDQAALEQRLRSISRSDDEFNARLQLALDNQADPGGTFGETPVDYCPDAPNEASVAQ